MPTLIDSLVLELQIRGAVQVQQALASTNTSLQQVAQSGVDSYGKLQRAAAAEAAFIAQARREAETYARTRRVSLTQANDELAASYAKLQPRLAQVHKGLADETRRTGFSMARNFDPAIAAVGEFASKALAAFAAVKTLQTGLKALGQEAAAGAQTNRAAYAANVNAGWLNRFQAAMFTLGNVNPATTQQGVMSVAAMVEHYRATGQIDERVLRAAQQAQVNLLELNSPEKIQNFFEHQLPRLMSRPGQTGAGAYELARLMGFEGLAPGLTKGEGAVAAEMRRAARNTATDKELEQLELLQQSLNRFETAMRGLYDALIAANPELRFFVDVLTEIVGNAKNSASALKGISDVLKYIFEMVMLGPFGPAVNALTRGLLGGGTSGGGAAPRGSETAPAQPAVPDHRSWWQRTKDWLSGTPAAATAPVPPSLGSGRRSSGGGAWGPHAAEVIDEFRKAGASEEFIRGAMANGLGEGGFATNWQKAWGSEESYGHWQLYRGGELPGYLAREGAANPQDSRAQARFLLRRMEEIHPGITRTKDDRLATDVIGTKFERYQGAAPGQRYDLLERAKGHMAGTVGTNAQARSPIPPNIPRNSKGMPYNPEVSDPDVQRRVAQSMAAIRAAQAAGRDWSKMGSNDNSTTNDVDFNGGIHVNVMTGPEVNPGKVGRAVGDEIRRNVYHANTGVE